MKLSTKGRYGLRAMIDLAVYSEKEPVSIQSIADRQNISERYLEQLMASLKKEGLVKSIRGANGGYQLARPAIRFRCAADPAPAQVFSFSDFLTALSFPPCTFYVLSESFYTFFCG